MNSSSLALPTNSDRPMLAPPRTALMSAKLMNVLETKSESFRCVLDQLTIANPRKAEFKMPALFLERRTMPAELPVGVKLVWLELGVNADHFWLANVHVPMRVPEMIDWLGGDIGPPPPPPAGMFAMVLDKEVDSPLIRPSTRCSSCSMVCNTCPLNA